MKRDENYIMWLSDASSKDNSIAGGKASQLGELIKFCIPVPNGFIITGDAFRKFHKSGIPKDVQDSFLKSFDKLGASSVAVRSSANVEDSKSASWAGELETYLNVKRDGLTSAVQKCWNSADSPRARAYKEEKGVKGDISVAVVVQEMVRADVAGVCFTVHPVTQDRGQMIIEAALGLGESVVAGTVTPDTYIVDKKTLKLLQKQVNTQETKVVFAGEGTKTVGVGDKGTKQKLSELQIGKLARLCGQIEKEFGSPQDIEWAMVGNIIFILQSRPITTL